NRRSGSAGYAGPTREKRMKADDVKKLQQRKYREQLGHYLVEGEHLILELFKAAIFQPHLANAQLFITENYADWVQQHNKLKLRFTIIGHKAMSQIADTQTPPGIIAAVPFAPVNGKEAAHAAHSERDRKSTRLNSSHV